MIAQVTYSYTCLVTKLTTTTTAIQDHCTSSLAQDSHLSQTFVLGIYFISIPQASIRQTGKLQKNFGQAEPLYHGKLVLWKN